MNDAQCDLGLQVVSASISDTSATLVWHKPKVAHLTSYRVLMNAEAIASRLPRQTHFTLTRLLPATTYQLSVVALFSDNQQLEETLSFTTAAPAVMIDVTRPPYQVDETGQTLATKQLQAAIDACPVGGTVLIPQGATVLSGALSLHSDMTLCVDGTLQGSLAPEDYLACQHEAGSVNDDQLVLSRYEGWEMFCYRSLLNAGFIDPADRHAIHCENLRICGHGRIIGGGSVLGDAERANFADVARYPQYLSDQRPGRRVRGRLICMMQCHQVELTGVRLENSPAWTVHMIYCDSIVTHGIHIQSQGIDNGDGWDPDSSRHLLLFDTTFDTGDDCVAIKSGKNPEGNKIAIPTTDVKIFDLKILGGHGVAIGSEQSGGVEDVHFTDCIIQNTMFGIELKAHPDRGGYIRHVTVDDCQIDHFLVQSVHYNADGQPAPTIPDFSDISVTNTEVTGPIALSGFTEGDGAHYLTRLRMQAVTLSGTGGISVTAAKMLTFADVCRADGKPVSYTIDPETTTDIQIVPTRKH